MKFLPGNFEDLEQLRERHKRLLREFERLKDENRQLKDQLELKHIRNIPDSILESRPGKNVCSAKITKNPRQTASLLFKRPTFLNCIHDASRRESVWR